MQYYFRENGMFTELPFKSVDAGAGLDRFAVVLQGADSVYETDLHQSDCGRRCFKIKFVARQPINAHHR